MRKLTIIAFLFLSGCPSVAIYTSDSEQALSRCLDNGGLDQYSIWIDRIKIHCVNGAVFSDKRSRYRKSK